MEAVFERIAGDWGSLDFVIHSIAFSPKDTLCGRVVDAPLDGFLTTMEVSCWSFIRMAHLAGPLMPKGGTLFTMSYYGSRKVVENYNIIGIAKAALESTVRYAISPGPLATRAASGMPEFDDGKWDNSPRFLGVPKPRPLRNLLICWMIAAWRAGYRPSRSIQDFAAGL